MDSDGCLLDGKKKARGTTDKLQATCILSDIYGDEILPSYEGIIS